MSNTSQDSVTNNFLTKIFATPARGFCLSSYRTQTKTSLRFSSPDVEHEGALLQVHYATLVHLPGLEPYRFCAHFGFSVLRHKTWRIHKISKRLRVLVERSPGPFLCAKRLHLCAPARTRTQNSGSEDRCDIHFTTGAYSFLFEYAKIIH